MIRSNFTPIDYLKIDIANNFGLDKENWDKRIDWFNQNEPDLENLVSKADSPCEFYAGILAYRKYQQSKPTGYMVGLDCTCSVLQWLSILTGDEDTAKLCNVINTGKREDAYTSIYKKLLEKFPELKDKGIGRSEVKKSIMGPKRRRKSKLYYLSDEWQAPVVCRSSPSFPVGRSKGMPSSPGGQKRGICMS